MKQIRQNYPLIDQLITMKDISAKIVPSKYNIIKEYNRNFIVFNTFTRGMILLDKSEFNVLSGRTFDVSSDIVKFLYNNHFLVDESVDETELYFKFYNIFKLIHKSSKGISTFKIYTTMCCNARCFYCFEKNMQQRNMSEQTTQDVIEYILKNKSDEPITLYWFGGEPLCNQKVIDSICNRLSSLNISFNSKIVTNGYLFDEKLVEKSYELWHLKAAQITLDGFAEEHNRRKAYINPKDNPFDRTIQNIHSLAMFGVKVTIRINFDEDNVENIRKLIPFLVKEFKGNKNITVIPVILMNDCFNYKSDKKENNITLMDALFEFEEKLYNENLRYFSPVDNGFKKNRCMADSETNAIISIDGKMFTCQNCEESMCYGSIYDGITRLDIINKWRNPTSIRDKCYNCPHLPECTPFDMCPSEHVNCIEENTYHIHKKMIATLLKESEIVI